MKYDLFEIEPEKIRAGMSYEWLALVNRGWDHLEELPEGWSRVPLDRHPEFGGDYRGWITRSGLTLCERPVAIRKRKLAQSNRWAFQQQEHVYKAYRERLCEIGVQPITDADQLIPPDDAVVFSTDAACKKNKKNSSFLKRFMLRYLPTISR